MKIHSKFKLAKDHTVIDIKEAGKRYFTRVKCQKHLIQTALLYCNKCHQLVCINCVNQEHRGHQYIEINKAYQTKLDEIVEKLKTVDVKAKNNQEKQQKFEQLINMANMEEFFSEARKILLKNNNFDLRVTQEYGTEMRCSDSVAVCPDGSLWIGSDEIEKVQKIKILGNKLHKSTSMHSNVNN